MTNKKYVDGFLDKISSLRFNQIPKNYLKASVGNTVYNLTRDDRKQTKDRNIILIRIAGLNLVTLWRIECKDRKIAGKKNKFYQSNKNKQPNRKRRSNELINNQR